MAPPRDGLRLPCMLDRRAQAPTQRCATPIAVTDDAHQDSASGDEMAFDQVSLLSAPGRGSYGSAWVANSRRGEHRGQSRYLRARTPCAGAVELGYYF